VAAYRSHRGRVCWDDRTPIPDALVAVTSGTAPTPEIAIRTDNHGRFRIALPAGRFRLQARAPGGATGQIDLEIGDEEGQIEIVVDR
jgi:hypothetical protein